MKQIISFIIIGSIITMPTAYAFSTCDNDYIGGQAPNIINENYKKQYTTLCFNGFSVGYSGITRTALWSAEHLTKDRINQAKTMQRVDSFHEEPRLPASDRSLLSDYAKSGYDRGHLSPNGDMPDEKSQSDSFTLANMVPQNPQNNRGLWKDIEINTRYLATRYSEVYVVTGGAFTGGNLKQINNHVMVPSYMYKAVYVPALNKATVYYAPNDASGSVEQISESELATRIGIDVMPALNAEVKNNGGQFPLQRYDAPVSSNSPPQTNNNPFGVGAKSSNVEDNTVSARHIPTSTKEIVKDLNHPEGFFTRIIDSIVSFFKHLFHH